jgi:membrane protein insertase Oxa1/YidC/SpoIIIJ
VQFLSAKLSMPYLEEEKKLAAKTKDSKDDMQVALQSSMIYTFPLMTLLIGLNFPSGLALYWVTFSVFQFIQQYRSQGWGGLTPLIKRLGLLQLRG